MQRQIGSSKGSSYLPLLTRDKHKTAPSLNFTLKLLHMPTTRGAAMARAHSTSSSSGISTDTEGRPKPPLAPRPVPFSPPKASLERDDFFRLYQVFCNLTAQEYQVCCTRTYLQQGSQCTGWLTLTAPAASAWHSRPFKGYCQVLWLHLCLRQ